MKYYICCADVHKKLGRPHFKEHTKCPKCQHTGCDKCKHYYAGGYGVETVGQKKKPAQKKVAKVKKQENLKEQEVREECRTEDQEEETVGEIEAQTMDPEQECVRRVRLDGFTDHQS